MDDNQQGWHRCILLILTIWFSNVVSMPLFYLLIQLTTQGHVYIILLIFFKGVVGYMPLGFQSTRLMAVISFANAALPYVLTAYLSL